VALSRLIHERRREVVLLALALPLLVAAEGKPPLSFAAQDQAWRARRLESLQSESGWLSLVGLYWLHEGENRFGADDKNDLSLPAGSAPAWAGSLYLEHGKVRVAAHPGAGVTLAGATISERADLASDDRPAPDELRVGDVRLTVIRRGDRVGIRAKSPKSPARQAFHGLTYFPPAERYRVTARLVRFDKPRALRVATIIGTVETMTAPGTLHLTLDGRPLELVPVVEGDDPNALFLIFRDATAGHETYGAGRFLYARLAADGTAVVDFNEAFNPPCAFTPYATCPLPPHENILPLRIEAGEKRYGEH
jgi:uncharacterized protein